MTIGEALVGAVGGTIVLTTTMRAAGEFGWTRMDLPLLLGTAVSTNRTRAEAIGYAAHFAAGVLFGLVYYMFFLALGYATWWLGALFGFVHALVASTALVTVLLPVIHPNMGSRFSASDTTPLIEPPGFLLLNYGIATPIVSAVAHVAYGAIIGAFLQR